MNGFVGQAESASKGCATALDPACAVALDRLLESPARHRLSRKQVTAAWTYAYLFFFAYPFDFPWRLMHLWKDVDEWPLRGGDSARDGC